MKPDLINNEDMFSLKKNTTDIQKNIKKQADIYNKTIITLLTFLLGMTFYLNDNYRLLETKNISIDNANSLQNIHQVKEDAAKLISEFSFTQSNFSEKLYNLEKNPLLNFDGHNAIINFISQKLYSNEQIDFHVNKSKPPYMTNSSIIAGVQRFVISVAITETVKDKISSYNLYLEFELIGNKYQLINISDKPIPFKSID